jgi:hypothetical protein
MPANCHLLHKRWNCNRLDNSYSVHNGHTMHVYGYQFNKCTFCVVNICAQFIRLSIWPSHVQNRTELALGIVLAKIHVKVVKP